MKKYPFFFLLALIVLVVAICTPNIMQASLPKVDYITAKAQLAKKDITVSGKITPKQVNIQFASEMFFAKEILVAEGDKIKVGDKLIKTEQENYILSEFDGIVESVLAKENSVCQETEPIVNIINTDDLCATLLVGENVFSKVALGQKVKLSGNAFSKKYKATITQIGAVATASTNSATYVEVIAQIENPDEKLKPGFNVKAKINVEKQKGVVVLPSSVISQDEKGEFVYKLVGNKAKKVYVKTDDITKRGTIIKQGVEDGELVISNPQNLTKDDSYISLGEQND